MKKVVIIGAGPAGLTAAYELCKKQSDYTVTVLEKTADIGGISKTVRTGGNRMDLGGHRFFSKDAAVTAWWQEVMPLQGAPALDDRLLQREVPLTPGGPDPETTDRVMLTRNRVSRIYYQKHFFDYPVRLKWSTLKAMGLNTTFAVGFSYLHSVVHKLPETSLENFYINSFGRKLYAMFFEGYTEKLWGRHPREISAEWGAQRTRGLSIHEILKDMARKLTISPEARRKNVQTSLIEEFRYPKFGPGQLWETVADDARHAGADIRTNCEVTGVETENGRIKAIRCRANDADERIEGDVFFSSMPLRDLIAAMDTAPADVRAVADGLPYRDFVTVGLLVNRLNLQNKTPLKTLNNIVPDCWIYVQDTNVKLGRIQIFNNWSPYMVQDPEHTVWIGLEYFCTEGDDFWNLSTEECVRFAADELTAMGIINGCNDVLQSHRERVQKAYPAYFDTYADLGRVVDYLNGFENLFCVGRNGQHRYNNMDHSMATSFEAVNNLVAGITTKENVWNVNTEKEYHEEKASSAPSGAAKGL
jgi:protoporphyrinogen oxidase